MFRSINGSSARVFMGAKATLLVLAISLLATSASGQFAIDWSSVGAGGGVASGDTFVLSATIGETSSGSLAGGQFGLDGGFWTIDSQSITSAAPALTIFMAVTNTVVVSWPSPSTGFALEQNTNLDSANWTKVSATPIDDGINLSIILDTTSRVVYLRLYK